MFIGCSEWKKAVYSSTAEYNGTSGTIYTHYLNAQDVPIYYSNTTVAGKSYYVIINYSNTTVAVKIWKCLSHFLTLQ